MSVRLKSNLFPVQNIPLINFNYQESIIMTHVLVLQHPRLFTLDLPKTRHFFQHVPHILDNRWRISVAANFVLPDEIVHELNQNHVDFGILPDYAFDEVKLIVSDMDSTLITIECIDEIAAQAGLKAQIEQITEQAMQGELDFKQSLHQRVALLKGLPESALQTVYDNKLKLNDGAEWLLQECHQYGVQFVLVSGGFTFFTDKLKTRLQLAAAFANTLEIKHGYLTGKTTGRIIDAQAKADILAQWRTQTGGLVVAIGDGANDIPMLQAADLGIAFHAKAKTRAAADLNIQHNGLAALRTWFR